jgi:1,4-dihydroxy-6-naphthoate synthase
MNRTAHLSIAYTPDTDDAFYYFALETGRTRLPGFLPEFHRAPIAELNRAALHGVHDVTAVSSVVYPSVSDRYAILSVGSSVGRGYGPVLVSRQPCAAEELAGRRVGVGGAPSTGWYLLRWLCPQALPVPTAFDRIADAVAAGELDAGVMIHEELLYYPQLGLHRVADLGAEWCRQQELPLPVGLNLIRRDLGRPALGRICAGLRRSLQYGLEHAAEGMAAVSSLGRGKTGQCTERFVTMFANQDSLDLPADVRAALTVLFREMADLGFADVVPPLDIVEPAPLDAAVPVRPQEAE